MKEGVVIAIIILSLIVVVPAIINTIDTIRITGEKIPLKNVLISGLILFICTLSGLLFICCIEYSTSIFKYLGYFLISIGLLQSFLVESGLIGTGKYIDKLINKAINKAKKKWKGESSQIPNSDFPQE